MANWWRLYAATLQRLKAQPETVRELSHELLAAHFPDSGIGDSEVESCPLGLWASSKSIENRGTEK
jgi:hypothetical protein